MACPWSIDEELKKKLMLDKNWAAHRPLLYSTAIYLRPSSASC